MAVVIPIVVILIVAAITVVVLANRARSSTGSLSRETRKRDAGAPAPAGEPAPSTSTELEAAGRERSDETQQTLGGGAVARRGRGAVVEYEPVDEEEIGVSRRQFLNRGLLAAVGFSLTGFGAAVLAFLWPLKNAAGFGGQINIGKYSDIIAYIQQNRQPFYAPNARTYIVQYPNNPSDLAAAKKVYKPAIYSNMSTLGIVALYQRCVHLGCRVPFCQSSQWFECPCHGSKYNRVGEKKAGPAPRGLDRFYATNSGGSIVVDTGTIYIGPPIGTNTTGQNAEGPLCV